MNRETMLRQRIKWLTGFFIFGLFISGATAIPLKPELNLLAHFPGLTDPTASGLAQWIHTIRDALYATDARYPFLAYGTDWLAFGHFMIAIAFIGAWRDPVRNIWLFEFGMIACVLIIPYAFIFGGLRGIPIYWRLIDCSFGVFGIIPIWVCRKWVREIQRMNATRR